MESFGDALSAVLKRSHKHSIIVSFVCDDRVNGNPDFSTVFGGDFVTMSSAAAIGTQRPSGFRLSAHDGELSP